MEEKPGAKKRLAHFSSLIVFISLIAFTIRGQDTPLLWPAYNDSIEINRSLENENPRMHFKLLTSRVTDRNEVFKPLLEEVKKLSEQEYQRLKPLILEQDIISLQTHINEGSLTYENLVLFYLYRIYNYELDPQKTLYTIIALNENVVEQARALDSTKSNNFNDINHPIYGMPILLKDNIGTQDMYTTAGAVALQRNKTEDAFIVKQLRNKGALILGKVNLSEWAYYMCRGCPVGYSAIGGQTLNPYGRGIFESGGSSSGSGAAVAANYAVAAVGTETSGSILSPSSQNSVVGLKPTIGLLSRTGIVPISSTLDTPGPMTRNVVDNAILLSAMTGRDKADKKSTGTNEDYLDAVLNPGTLKGKRLGVFKSLLETDSIYKNTIRYLRKEGVEIIEFTAPEVSREGFLTLLNMDMKRDLPEYLNTQVKNRDVITMLTLEDIVKFNLKDSLLRIPYGQAIFEGILKDSTTLDELVGIKEKLEKNGRIFFDTIMDEENLDAILSINNYHAAYAAVAKYPALAVPMGYKESGEPTSLTIIAKPFQESSLLKLGQALQAIKNNRKPPVAYQ